MDVLGDVVARDRRSDALALEGGSRADSYSYEKLCESAWKAGNLLRHYGVRSASRVAIVEDESVTPLPLVAFFGTALLGGEVRFDPPAEVTATVLLAPSDELDAYDAQPGCKLVGYGSEPGDPEVVHFEREAWSENPVRPPEEVTSDATALVTDHRTYAHADLLGRARAIVREYDLTDDDRVTVEGRLSNANVLTKYVLAPLVAGGTVVLDDEGDGDATGEAGR